MRFTFGAGPSDFAIAAPSGNSGVVKALPNLSGGSAWSAAVGGTHYTDLLPTGTDTTPIQTDANGYVRPFQGPDGIAVVWVDFGAGQRFRMVAQELANLLGPGGLLDPSKVPDLSGTYARVDPTTKAVLDGNGNPVSATSITDNGNGTATVNSGAVTNNNNGTATIG